MVPCISYKNLTSLAQEFQKQGAIIATNSGLWDEGVTESQIRNEWTASLKILVCIET